VLAVAAVLSIAGVVLGRVIKLNVLRPRGGRLTTRLSLVAVAALAMFTVAAVWPLRRPTHLMFRDRTNTPMFMVAAGTPGLLLTGGNLFLAQMRTRRPVLIGGGGLDGLAYAPESAVGMANILRDVYGIDIVNPPPEARGTGTVPNEANRAVWEGYRRDRWRDIRRRYGVTQVLTYPDWTLDLPVAARDSCCVLYDIPD
jgi:hypothetical protein